MTTLTHTKRVLLLDGADSFKKSIDTACGIAAGMDRSMTHLLADKDEPRNLHRAIFGEVEGIPRPSFLVVQHIDKMAASRASEENIRVPSFTWSSYEEPIWNASDFAESFLLHMSALNVDVLVINNITNALTKELRTRENLDLLVDALERWANVNNAVVLVTG